MESTSLPENPLIRIQKLTVRYDEREDRLHLAAQCDNGRPQGLWLTQRLANPLIQVLIKRLGDAAAQNRLEHQKMAMQVWEQAAAHAQRASTGGGEPVSVPPGAEHGLIDTINVVCHANGDFQLIFRWPTEQSLAFPITATSMRQWLVILRDQYRRADWSASVWPEWFEAALQENHDTAAVVH